MCPAMLASRWFKVKYNCQIGEKLKVGEKKMFQWRHQIFSSTILFFKSFFNGFAIFLKSCVFFHIVVEQCAFLFSLYS